MLHISTGFYYVQVSVNAGNEAVVDGAPKPKVATCTVSAGLGRRTEPEDVGSESEKLTNSCCYFAE